MYYVCMYRGLKNETETLANSMGGFTPRYAWPSGQSVGAECEG